MCIRDSFCIQIIYCQEVVINEIVSLNNSIYADRYGDYNDWVEIKNLSSDTLDLEGFWISDDYNDIFKWNVPHFQIPPNSFEILFCSGKNISDRGSGTVWETIIDQGSEWKYAYHGGSFEIPQNWRENSSTLNWQESESGFGYGDNDDATIIPATSGLSLRKIFYLSLIHI